MSDYCEWNDDAQETGIYVCKRCTQNPVRLAPSQRINVRRVCSNPPGPCAHLGESTRQQPCESCNGGKTRIKVFACAIHGECTLGKKLDGLACCVGCKEYQSKDSP